MTKILCPDCGQTMEEGFLLDRGAGHSRNQSAWVEGAPERSIWFGIKTHDKPQFEVSTYRCEKCGLLKSYAWTQKTD